MKEVVQIKSPHRSKKKKKKPSQLYGQRKVVRCFISRKIFLLFTVKSLSTQLDDSILHRDYERGVQCTWYVVENILNAAHKNTNIRVHIQQKITTLGCHSKKKKKS